MLLGSRCGVNRGVKVFTARTTAVKVSSADGLAAALVSPTAADELRSQLKGAMAAVPGMARPGAPGPIAATIVSVTTRRQPSG